uniref:Secreted protein n=1 Tax=Panagrellus redivivus TaxID=6233 RepID=A0A7E4W5K1_PANRE
MHCAEMLMALSAVALAILATDNAKEVEGGVQILKAGPIQLIIPDILSFTLKDSRQCQGIFRICYVSEPTKSRDEMRSIYDNVGSDCLPTTCTLWMEPEIAAFGLAWEMHDDTFYGLFVDHKKTLCPRYIVDGISNFTVMDVPTCPVIVDGAKLPKKANNSKSNKNASLKWIIPICVGLALL